MGNIYVGLKLSSGRSALRRAALALVAAHVVFGLVKAFGYGEAEAATFMLLDALAIGLLSTRQVRCFIDPSN